METPAPATRRLLFVDDDANLLSAFRRSLRNVFEFDTALGGAEALDLIAKQDYAVIVADMRMPLMDGIELLEKVARSSPHTVRVMLTGNADQQTAVDAVNRGQIFRFLNKPCPTELLQEAVRSALEYHGHRRRERQLLEETLAGSVRLMVEVLGAVSPDALGRGQRLRDSARAFCAYIGAPEPWEIEIAAQLVHLGYATLPSYLPRKIAAGAELSADERTLVKRVPEIGHDLLARIPRLEGVAQIVLHQRSRYDGLGVADGLAGGALPLGARVLRILDDRLELEADGVVKGAAVAELTRREGCYDEELLKRSFECFPAFLVQPLSAERPVLSLRVRDLSPGQVVVSEIVSREGVPFVASGARLTATVIARLRAHAELGDIREPVLVQEAGGAD